MNVLEREKQLAVISALVEGCSIRSTERLTGVHRDTIMRLMLRVGERCVTILDERMRNLSLPSVQVDELWTFVQKKQARLSFEERFSRTMGDQYCFVAIDAETKLIPHFDVGKRDMVTAYRFMAGLQGRLTEGVRFQLTTDGFVPYIGAVEMAWGADAPDFAQLVKMYGPVPPGPARYAPPKIVEAVPTVVNGSPDPALISTSYIERQNLTVRIACRRFTRLTNGFSKKLEDLKAALALHFAWYNFVRIHRSLRVTPAMAAGVTDRVWDLRELLA
jgi:IS1 family transposase